MWTRSPSSSRSRMASETTSRASTPCRPRSCLIDRAQLLTLTAPEMTVLIGGLRVLNTNVGQTKPRRLPQAARTPLTNDFFTNLLDMRTEWKAASDANDVFEGRDRATGALKWTGTRVDLLFGSNSQLRALAEVYGSSDAQTKFVQDFRRGVDQGDEPRSLRPCVISENRP